MKLNGAFVPPNSKFNKSSTNGINADITPWETSNSTDTVNGRGQKSPPIHEGVGVNDNYDPMFLANDRRPSTTSIATESSQSSAFKGGPARNYGHKTSGIHAEGRQSSIGSDTSAFTGFRDETSSSHSRRHNSIQYSNDNGRPISPSSSRPRTPLPSSEVTPWLFQEFKVGTYACLV